MKPDIKYQFNSEDSDCLCKRLGTHYFFYSLDTKGNFTFLSSGITLILGYSKNEFTIDHSTLFTDNPINNKVHEYTQQALSGNKQAAYTIEIYKKNQSTCWLEINETPVFDSNKQVIAVEGIARDISENIQYEDALKHALERTKLQDIFQSALNASDAGIFSYDIVNDKTWWDERSYSIFSVNPQKIPKTFSAWRKLVFKEDLAETEDKIKKILNSLQTQFQLEYRIKTNGNKIRWIKVKAQITRNKHGNPLWVDGLQVNITKTKELEKRFLQSEARFHSLVENSPDWIWETDEEGLYTYTSPHIKELLGYESKEVIDQSFFFTMPGDERARLINIFQEVFSKQSEFSGVEHINLHKNGSLICLETSGSPVYNSNGQYIGYRGIHRNITERAQTKNLRVEKEIAEQANASKSEFLANMSHELRTPMHAILSFSNFGIKKFNTTTPDKLLTYFKKINQSGERLLALLNDLLDLSKVESGKLEFSFVSSDMYKVLKQCTDEQEEQFKIKQLTLDLVKPECNTTAVFDPIKIAQVITNYLSNSIKFSKQGKCISIEIATNELYSDYGVTPGLCVSIKDQGIGIPDDELEHIFDKFVQSSKTKNNVGGTGLGLAICKEFIDAHQGRIWAEHNPQGGSIFNFTIPLKQVEALKHA